MNKRIFFHEMERSVAMERYADEQLEKIVKFLEHEREPIYLDLTIEAGRPHAHHKVNLLLKTPHYELIAQDEGPEAYKVLDTVIDTMYKNLRKKKEERVDNQKTTNWYKGT